MKILCFGDSNTYGYDPRSFLDDRYPADVRWNPDLSALDFSLVEATEFPGTSHEKITREVYKK